MQIKTEQWRVVDVLEKFVAGVSEFGLAVDLDAVVAVDKDVQQVVAHLAREASQQHYALVCGPSVTFGTLVGRAEGEPPTMVFTSFVAPKTADAFRRAGVQYLDTVGNAWIEFGSVLVDVRGRPRPQQMTRTRVAGGLFSARRAQVVFTLLAWPALWKAPQREIADASGVSLGQVHNTLLLLAQSGYGPKGARPDQSDLVDLWASAYPAGLALRLALAMYRGDVDIVKAPAGVTLAVSGEAAARGLLKPSSMTVYIDQFDPALPIMNRWRADGESNVVVRRKFWQAPGPADPAGVQPAPWPLVYADLRASHDPRVRGAAQQWRKEHA